MRNQGGIMEEDFKFEVGGKYKNMKGPYEVISIHRDSMVIRWTSGTELATTVDLQKKIIERMAFEKRLLQENLKKLEKAKKPKRKTKAASEKEDTKKPAKKAKPV
jgi:hypothetical protein